MAEHVQVNCAAGQITGTLAVDSTHFHSIPYAEFDTFGPSRLAAPRRIDASHPRDTQVALSITVPTGTRAGEDLPVLVYIHGGRYEHGSHAESPARGVRFTRAGVITVTVGYRLDLAGFVPFHDDEPNRYRGVDDCQTALEWIQRNIEEFGGDPTNVTLAGQSAGAGIALWLARLDHFRGGFRRVMAMSPAYPRQTFEQRKGSLRAALGRPITRAALSSAKPEALRRGYNTFRTRHITDMALGPAPLDGRELAEIPILLTCTREEFYNHPMGLRLDRAGLSGVGARLFGRQMGLRSVGSYIERARKYDPDGVARQLIGDSLIRRWVAHTAENAPGPLWVAEYAGTPEQPALHSFELPLVFHTLDEDRYFHDRNDEQAKRLTDLVHHFTRKFIHGTMPGWPQYGEQRTVSRLHIAEPALTVTEVIDPLQLARESFR